MTSAEVLRHELEHWRKAGRRPRLFLRDDDAIDVTPALTKLNQIAVNWQAPVLLGVIPKFATLSIGEYINEHTLFTPAVHGFAHKSHAPKTEKKIELGDHRNIDAVIDELRMGRDMLVDQFGERLSAYLVPPWNRIDPDVANAALKIGFTGISGFGWKDTQWPSINTHVDIVDWKQGKSSKSLDLVVTELVENLAIARGKDYAPTGILTHHLVHDEDCWKMLDNLFQRIAESNEFDWVRP